jgi:hypothetical protein
MVYPGFAEKVCSTCAGAPPFSICKRCATEDAFYRRGLCPPAAYATFDEILGDKLTRQRNGLESVFNRFVELGRPKWVLDWLGREHSPASILAGLVLGSWH